MFLYIILIMFTVFINFLKFWNTFKFHIVYLTLYDVVPDLLEFTLRMRCKRHHVPDIVAMLLRKPDFGSECFLGIDRLCFKIYVQRTAII